MNILPFIDDMIEDFPHKKYLPSAIGYYGGKYNALHGLLSYFPDPSGITFVEPFCGSAVVALNYNAPNNILNDKDELLVNFLRIFLGGKFKTLLRKYPEVDDNQRKLWRAEALKFDAFQVIVNSIVRAPFFYNWFKNMPDGISQAVAYYLGNRNNFSSIMRPDKMDYEQPRTKPMGYRHYKHFLNFCRRRDVRIWNLDFREVLQKVNGWHEGKTKAAFLYVDPPYLAEQGYQVSFTENDLRDLAELLKQCPHHWILSNEDSDIVQTCFAGFHAKKVRWSYTCAYNCSTKGRHELLISNRPFRKRFLEQSNTLDSFLT